MISDGIKMIMNTRDQGVAPLLFLGDFEKNTIRVFKTIVKKGMVVLDIGANVGYYSLIASRLVGKEGKVFAFEPEPNNFSLLLRNIAINSLDNIECFQEAVSDKKSSVKLYLDRVNSGRHTFSDKNVLFESGFIEVETIILDDFFEDVEWGKNIDVIKIDVQGAEGFVMRGMDKIIRNNSLRIIMEFWPFGLRNLGTDPLELFYFLQKSGFKINTIAEDVYEESVLEIRDPIKLVEYCERQESGMGWVNLLLIK